MKTKSNGGGQVEGYGFPSEGSPPAVGPDHKVNGGGAWIGLLSLLAWAGIILALFWGCTRCDGAECHLKWDAAAAAEQITSWKIYRGDELLAEVKEPKATIDLPKDQPSTLSLIAVNAAGQSDPATLTVLPVTPQFSNDMRVWVVTPKTFFVEAKPKVFFRFEYQKP